MPWMRAVGCATAAWSDGGKAAQMTRLEPSDNIDAEASSNIVPG